MRRRIRCDEVRVRLLERDELVVVPVVLRVRDRRVVEDVVLVEPAVEELAKLGVAPEDPVYVGDAPFDIEAAKNAGVHAVGVTWGGIHTRERMESEGPDAVVDTADELYTAL